MSCQPLGRQYLTNYLSQRLLIWYAAQYGECRASAQIIFPKGGRGLSHVTFTIFWHTIEHIFKTTLATDFKFGTRLCMGMTSGRTKISPKSGRGLGHVTLQLLVYDRTCLQNYLSQRLQIWYAALSYHCCLTIRFCILQSTVRQYGRLSQRQLCFLSYQLLHVPFCVQDFTYGKEFQSTPLSL